MNAILITDKANLYYLTGFKGSKGFLIVTEKKSIFFTDGRYIQYAKQTLPKFIQKKLIPKKQITLKNIKVIEFDGSHITVDELEKYKKIIKNCSFKNISEKIKDLRSEKDKNEIKLIKESQRINEKIFLLIKKFIQESANTKKTVREIDISQKIKDLAFEFGAETVSFDPIIAFGKNSSMPHHIPGKTKLKKGDIVLIDMGVKFKGYCSDMTRIVFTKPPTKEQKKIFEIVRKAQEAAFSQAIAGKEAVRADSQARKIIAKAGYGKFFRHGTGHGIGLEIHEYPSLSKKSTDLLQKNSIITIEPGIYLPGKFGIRLENMVLIGEKKSEIITKINNDLS